MAFNWIVATVCYYGLTLNSVGVGSSVFTSFSLSSAMEIPAYIFSAMVNKNYDIYIFQSNSKDLFYLNKFPDWNFFLKENFCQQKFDTEKIQVDTFF